MKDNNFEDQFREAFSAYEPLLSTDEIWENVEPHLKKKTKSRFLFFWLIGGLGLGLLGYGLNQWLPNGSVVATPTVEAKENNLPPVKSVIFFEEECIEPLTSTAKNPFVKAALLEDTKISTTIATIEKSAPSALSKKLKNNKIVYPSSYVVATEVMGPQDKVLDDKALAEKEETTEKSQLGPDLKKQKIEKAAVEKEEKQKQEKNKKKKTKKQKKKKVKKQKKKKRKKRIKPLRNKWKYHFQAVTGPVLPIRILTSNRDESLTNLRENSENPLGGFLVSSNFIAESPGGLVLSGGLEYMEFRERFRYETMEETTEMNIGTVAVVENAQGEIIETITGVVSTTTIRTRRIRHTNKYRYFNFPIGIGKAWRNGKSYWRVYGGLDFNLSFSFNGKIFTEAFTANGPIREVSRGVNSTFYDSLYRRKAGVGLWLSTEYSRPITNQLSWMIAPRIKLPFSSITTPDYEIKQRYVPISVQVGINYLINPPKKKKRRVRK